VHHEAVNVLGPVVDLLPRRLWKLGNNYVLPGGDWHFCVGTNDRLGHCVRTIEWRGRTIARSHS
jgi:hypothetical protein